MELCETKLRNFLKEKAFWFLLLMVLAPFLKTLLTSDTFFFRDLLLHYLPQRQLVADLLSRGELPLWDCFLHGGQPLAGNVSNSALYPTNLIYIFLPLHTALEIDLACHYLWGAGCAYLFARLLGYRPVAAFTTGVVFSLCGFTLSLVSFLAVALALLQVPALFLFWFLFLRSGLGRWFVLFVVTGAVQVFAGAPEINVMTHLTLMAWMLLVPVRVPVKNWSLRKKSSWSTASYPLFGACAAFIVRWLPIPVQRITALRAVRLSLLLALAVSLILGVSLVQVLPTSALASNSIRGQGLSYDEFSYWSLHPGRLPGMLLPEFNGVLNTVENKSFWGRVVVDNSQGMPYIHNLYFGLLVFLLVLSGLLMGQDPQPFPRRYKWLLLGFIGVGVVFGLGRFLPFFEFFFQHFPPLRLFRYPVKMLAFMILPTALLAGLGMNHIACGLSRSEKRAPIPSWLLWSLAGWLGLLLATIAMFNQSMGFSRNFQAFFFGTAGPEIQIGLTNTLAQAIFFLVLGGVILLVARINAKPWLAWALALLVFADLCTSGLNVNPTAPVSMFTKEPPIVSVVHDHIGQGRIFSHGNPLRILRGEKDHVSWLFRWYLEVFYDYLAVYYQVPIIFQQDLSQMVPLRSAKLTAHVKKMSWEERVPVISAGAASLIVSAQTINVEGVVPLALVPNVGSFPVKVYQNHRAAPPVGFVAKWQWESDEERILALMTQPDFDPKSQVILEPGPAWTGDVVPQEQAHCVSLDFKEKRLSNYQVQLEIENPCPGFLVFADPLYPGWRVKVDGKNVSLIQANYAFFAVYLPAGKHVISKQYVPKSLILGGVGSLGFLLLTLVISAGFRLGRYEWGHA